MNVVPMLVNPDAVQVTFEDFWKQYPRRVAKKDAFRAWQRIKPDVHQKLMSALEQQRKSEHWSSPSYIPYPATWLNGERWEDELDGDLTMGECSWNRNGNREPGKGKCPSSGTTEKNGIVYCAHHAKLI
jgi:hypothetical protein